MSFLHAVKEDGSNHIIDHAPVHPVTGSERAYVNGVLRPYWHEVTVPDDIPHSLNELLSDGTYHPLIYSGGALSWDLGALTNKYNKALKLRYEEEVVHWEQQRIVAVALNKPALAADYAQRRDDAQAASDAIILP